jgi:hypothetical protein
MIFRWTAHTALFHLTVSFKGYGTQAITLKQAKANRKKRK